MIKKIIASWNKMSTAKKSSLALMFALVFQKGISMISTPIFTRIMSTEQYGVVTNFNSWLTIIYIIATMNLAQGVFNNGMLEFEKDRNRFVFSLIVLANICTLIVFSLGFIVNLIFNGMLFKIMKLNNILIIILLLYSLFYPAFEYWTFKQRYEYKYKLLTLLTIASSIFQMVLGIILVVMSEEPFKGITRIAANTFVMIIIGLIFFLIIGEKSKFKAETKYLKYAFSFNVFLIPHFLAINILSSGDKVMIASMIGESKTAIYGVSYTAAFVIAIIWQAIEASWTPWLFENLKADNRDDIKKRANQLITLFAIISVSCMLFAPEIIKILASSSYYEGIYIIPAVTAGVFFTAVYALYMRTEYYYKKTKATMISSILAALLNIVLNYIFIKKYGYIAAGYTTLICYVTLYILHFIYCRLVGIGDIYNNKYIFSLSTIMVGTACFISLLYSHVVLRYAIILALLITALIFRKRIISTIKCMI